MDGFEKKVSCTCSWCKIYLIPYMLQLSCNLNWFRHLLQNCKWPAGINGVLFLSWSPPSWWETRDEICILFTTCIYACSRHRHHSKLNLGFLCHFQREDIWLLMQHSVWSPGTLPLCSSLRPCCLPHFGSHFCLLPLEPLLDFSFCWQVDGASLSLGCFMQPGGLIIARRALSIWWLFLIAGGGGGGGSLFIHCF